MLEIASPLSLISCPEASVIITIANGFSDFTAISLAPDGELMVCSTWNMVGARYVDHSLY